MWNLKNNTNECICKTDIENKLVVTKDERGTGRAKSVGGPTDISYYI